MRFYSSFLVRCWVIQDSSQAERHVFDIEHVQTGQHTRLASLTEVQRLIARSSRPEFCDAADTSQNPVSKDCDEAL